MQRLLTALFALALFGGTATVQAQTAGGGPSPTVTRGIENYTYLTVGLANPSGGYGSLDDEIADVEEAYAQGRGAESGYFVEFGGTRYLWESPAYPLGIGLGWATSFSWFSVDWKGLYEIDEFDDVYVETEAAEGVLDFRLGPTVVYQVQPGFFVEAALKLGPGISSLQEAYFYDEDSDDQLYSDIGDAESVGFGLRRTFGVSASYGPFLGGLEFNSGSATYERSNGPDGSRPYTAEVDMKATRLFVGFRF